MPVVVISVNVAGEDELWGFVEGVLPGSWNDPTGFAADAGPATSCVGIAGEDHFIIQGPGFGFASEATYDGTGSASPFVLPYDMPPS